MLKSEHHTVIMRYVIRYPIAVLRRIRITRSRLPQHLEQDSLEVLEALRRLPFSEKARAELHPPLDASL
jgi:hypothetical protein